MMKEGVLPACLRLLKEGPKLDKQLLYHSVKVGSRCHHHHHWTHAVATVAAAAAAATCSDNLPSADGSQCTREN